MGLLVRARRQDPPPPPSAVGIDASAAVTIDPDAAPTSTLLFDPSATGGGFPSGLPLVSGHTPVVTLSNSLTPTSSADPSETSAPLEVSSNSSKTIALSTVIGSCVGAFIGAIALICLGLWFYRRYQRSLKSHYRSKSRAPHNTRGDFQRRLSNREQWGKLEDSNPEDKWEGQAKRADTEESVAPMEKLTMFKKTPSTRTAYTHTTEEPTHFEIPHPFAHPYSNYNNTSQVDHDDNRATPSMPKPHVDGEAKTTLPWDDTAQGSFLSVRTQSERLSGAMSPSLNMAIPTPPATSSYLHHWESAEIINFDGQSAEIVDPFADNKKPAEQNNDNPFFGAYEHAPKRRSRAGSSASRIRSTTSVDLTYIPVPRLDKGKGKAADPFHDDHEHVPIPRAAAAVPITPTIVTSIARSPSSKVTPISAGLPPPQPAFATHISNMSASSVASSEHALASLLAALDGDTTQEEVQARLRIASMQPSISSAVSQDSDGDDDVMTHAFPLPPSTPGGASTPTIESYFTAESNRTVR